MTPRPGAPPRAGKDPARILRFGLVGCVGFLSDAGGLAVLLAAGVPPVPARVVSIAVALFVTWQLNRRLAFRSPHAPSVAEFARYVAVGATSSLVNFLVYTGLLVTGVITAPLLATAAGSAAAMTVTFLGLDRFVFGPGPLRPGARRQGPRSTPR